jgi:hypothetical protein
MEKYTYQEFAENWELWMDYVDPGATMTKEAFDEMSTEEKIKLCVECFGPDDGSINKDWYHSALQNGNPDDIQSWFTCELNTQVEIDEKRSVWVESQNRWLNQDEIDNLCKRIDNQ